MNLDENTLYSYINGDCTEEQLEIINKWLAESPENEKQLFRLKLALELPQRERFGRDSVVSTAEEKLMARIDRYERAMGKKTSRRNMIIRWASVAAAAAIIIIAGVFIFRDDIMTPDTVSVSVAPGEDVKEVSLPDGSRVWLNSASALTYSSAFGQSDRRLYLEGEGYFEVSHNDALSFIVASPAVRVIVHGTTFNMKSHASDRTAEVTLITGSIEVRGNRDEGQIVLTPGQKAEIDLVSKKMTVRNINAKLDAVWHNNLIPFDDASIGEIARALEQLYNVRMVLGDDLNIRSRYSGVIHRKKRVEEVLDLLKNSIPISYSIDETTVTLSNRND